MSENPFFSKTISQLFSSGSNSPVRGWASPPPPNRKQRRAVTKNHKNIWGKLNRANQLLKKYGIELNISQVVVVGDQSSGKSSTIEHFVGVRGFLPRGTGIVTKVPIILSLQNDPDAKTTTFTFEENKQTFTVPSAVDKEIRRLTEERLKKSGKSVSSDPITITITSSTVPDITLVDLPGLVDYNKADGDLPAQIEELVHSYIKPENTTILVVTENNKDIANSKGLKAACKVDPSHMRTLGVITKCDVENPGDVTAVTTLNGTGENVPDLGLGWFGVVNPNPKQANDQNLDMKQATAKADKFFEKHEDFKKVLDRCGHDKVIERVQNFIFNGVHQRKLEEARRAMIKQREDDRNKLKDLFEGTSSSRSAHALLNDFTQELDKIHEGRTNSTLGAELADERTFKLEATLNRTDLSPVFNDKEITETLYITQGAQASLSVAEKAVVQLIPEAIKLLDSDLKDAANKCSKIVVMMIMRAADKTLSRKPAFKAFLLENVLQMAKDNNEKLIEELAKLIERELFVNSRFLKGYAEKVVKAGGGPIVLSEDQKRAISDNATTTPSAPPAKGDDNNEDDGENNNNNNNNNNNTNNNNAPDADGANGNNKSLLATVKEVATLYFKRVCETILFDFPKYVDVELIRDIGKRCSNLVNDRIDEHKNEYGDVNDLLIDPPQIESEKKKLNTVISERTEAIKLIDQILSNSPSSTDNTSSDDIKDDATTAHQNDDEDEE